MFLFSDVYECKKKKNPHSEQKQEFVFISLRFPIHHICTDQVYVYDIV